MPPRPVYQFKITLGDASPPIWRRIQVKHCTLDKLHEHIQTAMGWTNSHLHLFQIGEQRYVDPELFEEDWSETEYQDSTTTRLTDVLPTDGAPLHIRYEYDFGDGWIHDVLFEGVRPAEPGVKYPICLEGKRACPPEDVGGLRGYADYLEALADPTHEEHEMMLEWNGPFDPEAFDAEQAGRAMRRGLPDWRDEY